MMNSFLTRYSIIFPVVLILGILLINGCGEAPPDLPHNVPNIGAISISGSLQYKPDSVYIPDEIAIVFNGEYLGYLENPYILQDVLVKGHLIKIYFPFRERLIRTTEMQIEVVFEDTVEADFDTRTGAISILNVIEVSPDSSFTPDSIYIVFDEDTLGYHPNPVTINYVPEGEHAISTYGNINSRDYLGPEQVVDVFFNQISEVHLTLAAGGIVIVTAFYDGAPFAELGVRLDGVDYGTEAQPRAISNIPAGLHRLVAYGLVDTTKLEAWQGDVEVALAETTEVDLELQVVNPFVGSHAPNIDCIDIEHLH